MEYFRWATKRQLMIHNKNENIYYHCDCQCGAICFLWLFLFGVVAFFFLFVLIYYMTWLFVAAQIRWMLWMEPHECVNLCLASVHGAPRSLGFFSISHVQIKGPRKTGLIALTICPIHFLRLILILIKFFFCGSLWSIQLLRYAYYAIMRCEISCLYHETEPLNWFDIDISRTLVKSCAVSMAASARTLTLFLEPKPDFSLSN